MSTTIFEKQGSNLTVYPKGRLDTVSSPVLEQELKQYLDDVENVTMDFAEVDYITSGGLRVLLAEDQPINAEIAATILEEAGASVDHAEDGAIASRMFQESGEGWYDVVLMDLRMPNMNGFEAARAIRSMDRPDAGIVIIALTADAFAEDAQRCMDAGMDAHMAKPVNVKMLLRKLAGLHRRRQDSSGEE